MIDRTHSVNRMLDLVIKPIPQDQLNKVVQLIVSDENRRLLLDITGFTPNAHDIYRHTVGDPDFRPELFLGAYKGTELVGNVLGIHRPWKKDKEYMGFLKWIFVKHKYRRRGVGGQILEKCEHRLVLAGCNQILYGSSAPLYLFPGVPVEDKMMREFLNAHGWKECSERVNLDINVPDANLCREQTEVYLRADQAISIAISKSHEKDRLFNFIREEFSHSWALESLPALRGDKESFCCYLSQTLTGNILGFAVVNATNPSWFGPMGVKASSRMSGLGRRLVWYSLRVAQNRGIRRLIFPWVNESEVFYRKVIQLPIDRPSLS